MVKILKYEIIRAVINIWNDEIAMKILRRKGSCGKISHQDFSLIKRDIRLRRGLGQRIFLHYWKKKTLSESTRCAGLTYSSPPHSWTQVGGFLVDYKLIT